MCTQFSLKGTTLTVSTKEVSLSKLNRKKWQQQKVKVNFVMKQTYK